MIYNRWKVRKAPSSWFASCCGASYSQATEKTKFSAVHKGIRVFDGHVSKEYNGPKQSLKHISTRNGNITISIRHSW